MRHTGEPQNIRCQADIPEHSNHTEIPLYFFEGSLAGYIRRGNSGDALRGRSVRVQWHIRVAEKVRS